MTITAEEKFRKRAREKLEKGEDFQARGETNKAILEELKKEVAAGRKSVQNAAYKAKVNAEQSIGKAKDQAVSAIEASKQEALQEIAAAAASGVAAASGKQPCLEVAASTTAESSDEVDSAAGAASPMEEDTASSEAGAASPASSEGESGFAMPPADCPLPNIMNTTLVGLDKRQTAVLEEIREYGCILADMPQEAREAEIKRRLAWDSEREKQLKEQRRLDRLQLVENKRLKRGAWMAFGLRKADFQRRKERRLEETANLLVKLPIAAPDAPEYVPLLNEFWTCGYNSYADELRECNGIKLDQMNWDLQEARGQCRLCCALWPKDWAVDRACHEHTPELIYKDRAASTAEMQESFWAEAIDWAVHTLAVRLQRTQEERAEREEAALKWEAEERAREERSEIDLEICAQVWREFKQRCLGCDECESFDPLLGSFCPDHMEELQKLKEERCASHDADDACADVAMLPVEEAR